MPATSENPMRRAPSWIRGRGFADRGISRVADGVTDREAKIGDPVLAERRA
jgi:hypothetical protein